jgi:hypothetical protein
LFFIISKKREYRFATSVLGKKWLDLSKDWFDDILQDSYGFLPSQE